MEVRIIAALAIIACSAAAAAIALAIHLPRRRREKLRRRGIKTYESDKMSGRRIA